jgi:omega-6 fatty acid desaturase (delta-12 desaturase)
MNELFEAMGDSPFGAFLGSIQYLLIGWPAYLVMNAAGQKRYPGGTNHFDPNAVMFKKHQWMDIVVSDVGILLWIGAMATFGYYQGFLELFRVYLVPYLWLVFSRSPVDTVY